MVFCDIFKISSKFLTSGALAENLDVRKNTVMERGWTRPWGRGQTLGF